MSGALVDAPLIPVCRGVLTGRINVIISSAKSKDLL
jgi:hypothetical protein